MIMINHLLERKKQDVGVISFILFDQYYDGSPPLYDKKTLTVLQ